MSRIKKFTLKFLVAIFVFVSVFGTLFLTPRPAKAAPPYDDTITASFLEWAGMTEQDKAKSELDKNANYMVMSAVINMMQYFANKIAYDMGVWLASGNLGQGPFANPSQWGSYLAQVAGDSLGESLGSLSESLGLNLCDLPDLQLDLALQLGFHMAYKEPKPKCSWQQLKQAYSPSNIQSKYASKEGLANRLNASIAIKDTDFGVSMEANARISQKVSEYMFGKEQDRQEGQGTNAMVDLITGNVKTPAVVMKEQIVSQSAAKQGEKQEAANSAQVWGAFGTGATQVAYQAASVFINTMLGTMLKNFMEKGMLPGGYKIPCPPFAIGGVNFVDCVNTDETDVASSYYSGGYQTSQRQSAEAMFAELLVPQITTLDNYNLFSTMALCDTSNHSPDTCVVDQSFLQILQSADSGEPLSVRQAMEKGWLHGDWLLVSSGNAAQNDKWDCASEAYCRRNLKFLRQARVLPVGFEIATTLVGDLPVTLKQAVDGFYDPNSIFHNLINPNWIIKLPKLRCKAFVYGPVAQNGARVQECADIQHCVGYNKDGSCQAWGYCMKERPIWKISADYCEAEYNTCRAYSNSDGDSAAYLTRTLDTTSCTSENDGCRRYATGKLFYSATNTVWFTPAISYNSSAGVLTNTSIQFNNKAAECKNEDDGCSAYKLASNPDTFIYLRKAPDYLGCYDADTKNIPEKIADGIQWPQSVAELNSIDPQSTAECGKYAQVCIPEEENCNFYTSLLTKDIIPGKFTPAVITSTAGGQQLIWNDQCAEACDGYAAYREMPSNYYAGQAAAYIIPKSGKTCTAADAGCTAFTNLNATQGGLSQTEYFSYLRLCILPDQNKQKNFTVYESSERGGFQLKTYTLEKNAKGGPKQLYRDEIELETYSQDNGNNKYCGADSYAAKTADPDCHQFIDSAGTIYYALLSKTVLASENCTPYRLNSAELVPGPTANDLRCPFDFEQFDASNHAINSVALNSADNSCRYYGLPSAEVSGAGQSRSCAKDTDSCRAYKGNAGNNVRNVFSADFENSAAPTGGFVAYGAEAQVARSTESTQIGGHSMKISVSSGSTTDHGAKLAGVSVMKGRSYILSFWAKGDSAITMAGLSSSNFDTEISSPIQLGDVWRYYTFGPVEYNNDVTTTALFFRAAPNGSGAVKTVFIDNIKLMEVTDYIYLVKNSLSVDALCDSNLTDNLPGEALGCTAYQDPLKNKFYLTNFSYLCREGAVGCTAVLDTYNTPDDPGPRAYNVWLSGAGGTLAEVTIDGDKFSCQVPQGDAGCYTNIFGKTIEQIHATANAVGTNSTVYIPPDTPIAHPVYLVAGKDAVCKQENIGCQVLGKSTLTPMSQISMTLGNSATYEETAVRNDPENYESTLCTAEAIGCRSWESDKGTSYFKDPKLNGNKICTYVTEPTAMVFFIGGQTITVTTTGWLWKDVGLCGNIPGLACSADSDCGAGKCQLKNQLPCYPLFRKADNEFGLWSFGNAGQYQGFVGECPPEQNGCSEFIDHSGEASSKCVFSGKKCAKDADCNEIDSDYCGKDYQFSAYYLLDNDKLKQAQNKCNGLVSQAEGCALLDNTAQPNKYWNTNASYSDSINQNDKLVTPKDSGATNDANVIMKVGHDRECAEWAYCDLQQAQKDQDTGEITSRCYSLGVCQKAALAVGTKNQCAKSMGNDWVGKDHVLTADYYKSLPKYWNSLDLSGYSVPGDYQVPDLKARQIDNTYRLVHVTTTADCKADTPAGKSCGPGGACYNGECLVHFGGGAYTATSSSRLICRGYPEGSSPFTPSVLVSGNGGTVFTGAAPQYKEGYEGVNLCYDKNGAKITCDCDYSKLKTGGGDVYSNTSLTAVCVGGNLPGKSCNLNTKTDCCLYNNCDNDNNPGTCTSVSTLSLMNGWKGYCMEWDQRQRINGTESLRCLTWWPLELPPGSSNVWAGNTQASYQQDQDKDRNICLENEPVMKTVNRGPLVEKVRGGDLFGAFNYDIGGGDGITMKEEGDHYKIGMESKKAGVFFQYYDALVNWQENGDVPFYRGLSTKTNAAVYIPLNKASITASEEAYNPISFNNTSQNNFYLNEIEQITIIMDDTNALAGEDANGQVTFTNNIIDKEGPDFLTDKTKLQNVVYSPPKTGKADSLDCTYVNNYNLYAWEWWANGQETDGFFTANYGYDSCDEPDSQCPKADILDNICNAPDGPWNINGSSNIIVSAENPKNPPDPALYRGIGIRIVWDKGKNLNDKNDDILKGVWIDEGCKTSGSCNVGLLFAITFTDGKCAKFARVSEKAGGADPAISFGFKPFTARLKTGVTSIDDSPTIGSGQQMPYGNYNSLKTGFIVKKRVGELDNPEYGLINDTVDRNTLSSSTPVFVNPFIGGNTDPLHLDLFSFIFGQAGDIQTTYDPGYLGGVPLLEKNHSDVVNDASTEDKKTFVTIGGEANCKNNGGKSPYCGMISSMFAKVYNSGKWSNGKYGLDNISYDVANPNSAKEVGVYIRPPIIAAPVTAKPATRTNTSGQTITLNAIAVEGQPSGNVYINSGASTMISFYAWASPDQMPLRRIAIDKNDGRTWPPPTMDSISMGNKKPFCGTMMCFGNGENEGTDERSITCQNDSDCPVGDSCKNVTDNLATFGSTEDTGCEATPFEFITDYTTPCETAYRVAWGDANSATKYGINWEDLYKAYGKHDYICAFQPRVQTMDNWEWCAGSCSQDSTVVRWGGCYGTGQCNVVKGESWIKYNGYIIVIPVE